MKDPSSAGSGTRSWAGNTHAEEGGSLQTARAESIYGEGETSGAQNWLFAALGEGEGWVLEGLWGRGWSPLPRPPVTLKTSLTACMSSGPTPSPGSMVTWKVLSDLAFSVCVRAKHSQTRCAPEPGRAGPPPRRQPLQGGHWNRRAKPPPPTRFLVPTVSRGAGSEL